MWRACAQRSKQQKGAPCKPNKGQWLNNPGMLTTGVLKDTEQDLNVCRIASDFYVQKKKTLNTHPPHTDLWREVFSLFTQQ